MLFLSLLSDLGENTLSHLVFDDISYLFYNYVFHLLSFSLHTYFLFFFVHSFTFSHSLITKHQFSSIFQHSIQYQQHPKIKQHSHRLESREENKNKKKLKGKEVENIVLIATISYSFFFFLSFFLQINLYPSLIFFLWLKKYMYLFIDCEIDRRSSIILMIE